MEHGDIDDENDFEIDRCLALYVNGSYEKDEF